MFTDFHSSRFQYTFGPHPPTVRIEPKSTLRVTCPDSDGAFSDLRVLGPDQQQTDPDMDILQANPLAGPIHIEGARRGDVLAVTIDEVELDRRKGQTWLGPGHGLLPEHLVAPRGDGSAGPDPVVPRQMYHWDIDPQAGIATVTNPLGDVPIVIRLDPFVGCIGVCPKSGQAISSLHSGSFGGNLDLPLVRPGTTVFLPIFHDGALLLLGDVHAAQGHGEIIGGGIETSGKIICTVDVFKKQAITAGRIWDGKRLWAIMAGCARPCGWRIRTCSTGSLRLESSIALTFTISSARQPIWYRATCSSHRTRWQLEFGTMICRPRCVRS